MKEEKLKESISEFSEHENRRSVLLLAEGVDFRDAAFLCTKQLKKQGESIIYFSTNKPFQELTEELEYEGIDPEELYFLDVISKKLNIETKQSEKVYYGDTPAEVNNLLMNISDVLSKWSEPGKVLLLDSFTGLLIYNSTKSAGKFLQRLDKKIKNGGMKGLYIAIKEQIGDELIEKLMEICDEKIDLTES